MIDQKKRTLIFLVTSPISKRMIVNMGIDSIDLKKFYIHLLDIGKIFYPNYQEIYQKRYEEESQHIKKTFLHINFYTPNTVNQVYLILSSLQPSKTVLMIFNIPFRRFMSPMFISKIKTKFPRFKYAILSQVSTPGVDHLCWSSWNQIAYSCKALAKNLIFYFLSPLFPKMDYLLISGNHQKQSLQSYVNSATITESIMHGDVLGLLRDSGESAQEGELTDYILYLDSGIADVMDSEIHTSRPKPNAVEYYNNLYKFLKFLEKEHEVRVVIAAHPSSSRFIEVDGMFHDIRYFRNKTHSLAKSALFFIADYPTNSIAIPVYLKKPLLLFSSSDLISSYKKQSWEYRIFKGLEKILNKKFVHLYSSFSDHDRHLMRHELNNISMYNKYYNDYIKGAPGLNILLENILRSDE